MCTSSEGRENKGAVNTTNKSFPDWALNCDGVFLMDKIKPMPKRWSAVPWYHHTEACDALF